MPLLRRSHDPRRALRAGLGPAHQPNNSFRDKLGRYIAGHADDADRRRKAMTALTAKMARVAHAVVKTGTEYRPFLERPGARWKDPSLQVP